MLGTMRRYSVGLRKTTPRTWRRSLRKSEIIWSPLCKMETRWKVGRSSIRWTSCRSKRRQHHPAEDGEDAVTPWRTKFSFIYIRGPERMRELLVSRCISLVKSISRLCLRVLAVELWLENMYNECLSISYVISQLNHLHLTIFIH